MRFYNAARRIFIMVSLFFITWLVSAKNYYFASSGSDGGAGTQASPWQTIGKLNSFFNFLNAGDSVLFNRGDVFYGTLIPTNGFTSPVIFSAYGIGANPVITGFQTVSSWTNLGENIWESTSPVSKLNDVNVVLINNVNTAMGRTPNSGWWNVDSHTSNTSITSTSLNAFTTNWTGGDVVMKVNNFMMQRNPITSASGSTINYTAITSDSAANNFGFFIENDSLCLDQQNEWWYSPSRKKLRIYSTSAPTNVQASTLDTLVYITQKSNFTFDHIDFTGANKHCFYIGSCDNITIQYCNIKYCLDAFWGGNNWGLTSKNLQFNYNTVTDVNSKAIYLESEYHYPHIWNNTFKRIGIMYGMFHQEDTRYGFTKPFTVISTGFDTDSSDIGYNAIDSTGYNGIDFGDSHGHFIHNNEVSHYCMLLMDGGGIYGYSGTKDSVGSIIEYNIVHDGIGDNTGTIYLTDHLASSIYNDEGFGNSGIGEPGTTNHLKVRYNTCFNNPLSGIYCHGNISNNYNNNLCYNNHIQFLAAYSNVSFGHDDTLLKNTFVAKDSLQYCAEFDSDTTMVNFFSKADSNYYAKPIFENAVYPYDKIFVSLNRYGSFRHYTLKNWQDSSGYDLHSTSSPVALSNMANMVHYYNTGTANKSVILDGTYIDMAGNSYTSLTLLPYSSVVLIKIANPAIPNARKFK